MGSMTIVIILVSTILPIALVVIIMGALMKSQKQTDELLRTGMPARGRILQLGTTGTSVAVMGHRHLKLIMTVEVHPQMGAPYTASFEQLVSELQIPSVQPGAEIELRIDPRNPARMAMAGVGAAGMGQPQAQWGQQQAGYRAPPAVGPAPVAVMTPQYKSAFPMMAIIMFITTVPTAAILLYVFVDFKSMFGGSSSSDEDDEGSAKDESDEDSDKKKSSKKKKSGGVCSQAAACCKVVSGGVADEACKNFEGMPVEGCRQALDGYKTAAKSLKKTCD